MKKDSLFYRIFKTLPSLFFELINQEGETDKYRFDSVEIKQTAFRIDGVFLPNNPQDLHIPIYFVEVQFQTDEDLYKRLFAELFLYLKHSELGNNWQCVVIYPNRKLEPKQVNNYSILLNSHQVTRIYLDELDNSINSLGISVLKLITESEETAGESAKQLISITKQQEDNLSQKIWLELIETIIVYKYSNLSREEVEKMLGLSDLKQTRVYQEGKEEGREEGQVETLRANIISILRKRFQTLPSNLSLQINSLEDTIKLQQLLLETISVNSLSEFQKLIET